MIAVLCVFALAAVSAAADEDPPPDQSDTTSDQDAEQKDEYVPLTGRPLKFTGKYGRWIKEMERMAMEELDLWGASTTVPQGFLVPLFGYGTMRAAQRFDNHRKLTDIIPIFNIDDPFNVGGDFFSLDFNVQGSTKGYLAGLTYGVTDNIMVGASIFFADIEIKMDPIFTPGSSERLGVATRDEFYKLLEKLGRPRPKHVYKSDPFDAGDLDMFVTWNWYRTNWFSTASTLHVFAPTAHQAEPDKALIFALGPDLDTGNAAWGIGLGKVFDFRPPAPADVVTFTFTVDGAVFFQSKRRSPEFLAPNRDVWDYMKSQGVELDFFPNLSDIDSHYYYTPPPWIAVSGGIGLGIFGISYRHGWGFEGKYETNSPGFKQVIDEIGLVGTGDDGKIIVSTGLPLTPLYIPALAQIRFEYVTDGRNAMVFRDIYQIGVGFLIPLAPPEKYRLKE
ncbi:MAG: hypothetical protein P9L99_18300 [Candidatus Lernaella stagnicola]|nr:hypothetical protein [Candidatus Lernaella stagnicola]